MLDLSGRDVLSLLIAGQHPPVLSVCRQGSVATIDDHNQTTINHALNFLARDISIAQSLEKLNRYERKYGPGAPQLNIAEVGLNFVAQWIPLFLPDPEDWPSRLEVVASYVPGYLTVVDEKARPVTVAELGLRSYIWRTGWGGKEGGVLRPGYVSFGVAVAGARDGAFVSPLQGKARVGAYLGWGVAKVAFLGGREKRLLVTRQFQVVPFMF